jgi:hypothetical protein
MNLVAMVRDASPFKNLTMRSNPNAVARLRPSRLQRFSAPFLKALSGIPGDVALL